MKKFLFSIFGFIIVLLVVPINAYADEYNITRYNIDIIVNENNTMDITEDIEAYFHVYKHGIFRKIPLSNSIERLDGSEYRNRAYISNIYVSEQADVYNEGSYKVIKIGDPNYTLIGKKNYTIGYNYNIGRDPSKDYDEFYFNLIGPEWDTSISDVSFTITLPKAFNAEKIGFSSGVVGSTSNNVTYSVEGRTITGVYNGILMPGEALTVRIELPEGYFVGASTPFEYARILMVVIPLICLFITYVIWLKYGKDNEVVEVVGFYPPDGFNSLELAFLYKGAAESEDVTSLLVYLANCGYIKIVETEHQTLFSKYKDFKIVKLKDYDGKNYSEKEFLDGLFKKKKRSKGKAEEEVVEVTLDDLENRFYKVVDKILKSVNSKENINKIFEVNAKWKSGAVIAMVLLSVLAIVLIPTLDYGSVSELIITIVLVAFYTPFYTVGLAKGIPFVFRAFWLGFTIFHSSMFFMAMPIGQALLNDSSYLLLFIIGVCCIIFMLVLFNHLPKRTAYGNEMLGKILGFKNFLEYAEKEKIESMVLSNPTYFYDILPYTYVLGVSDTWINKFEAINMVSPDWYSGTSTFNVRSFGGFINTAVKSASSSMNSSPSSSSGGGSSGGGSSGGGSGGGGGGSW